MTNLFIIVFYILNIVTAAKVVLVEVLMGEHPSKVCQRNGLFDIRASTESMYTLTSILQNAAVNSAYVGGWHDSVADHVIYSNGAIAPHDLLTNATHHALCLENPEALRMLSSKAKYQRKFSNYDGSVPSGAWDSYSERNPDQKKLGATQQVGKVLKNLENKLYDLLKRNYKKGAYENLSKKPKSKVLKALRSAARNLALRRFKSSPSPLKATVMLRDQDLMATELLESYPSDRYDAVRSQNRNQFERFASVPSYNDNSLNADLSKNLERIIVNKLSKNAKKRVLKNLNAAAALRAVRAAAPAANSLGAVRPAAPAADLFANRFEATSDRLGATSERFEATQPRNLKATELLKAMERLALQRYVNSSPALKSTKKSLNLQSLARNNLDATSASYNN